jgi:hypothetical protein
VLLRLKKREVQGFGQRLQKIAQGS